MVAGQIDSNHPQGEHRQGLVGPAEVLPQHIEAITVLHLPDKQQQRGNEQGYTDHQATHHALLLKMQCLGNDKARAAEGCITARDGGCHHTQHSQRAAKNA